MTLTVYIASITGNTEIRKQVQRTLMILDGLGVPFKTIDITLRGNEEHRKFMRENANNERCDGVPLPPQFFLDDKYLGNYLDFEEAVEDNLLPEFLQLVPPTDEGEEKAENEDIEDEDYEGYDDEKYDEEDEQEGEGEEEEEEEDEEEDEAEKENGNDAIKNNEKKNDVMKELEERIKDDADEDEEAENEDEG